MRKEFSILLNVSVNADSTYWRTEYYVRFKAWKYGVVTGVNQMIMNDSKIFNPCARWSEYKLTELGRVLRDAAVEMMKAELEI